MSQARISVMENPNYKRFNVRTLQRLAAAFDVALVVRFVSFGEFVDWTVIGSQKALAPLSFDEEFAEAAPAVSEAKQTGEVINVLDRLWEKLARESRTESVASSPPMPSESRQIANSPA
jgi:hypothetical protein